MPWITLALLTVACAVGGGIAGWMVARRYRPLLAYALAGLGAVIGAGLLVMGSVAHGMEGIAYAVPAVLLVIPAALGGLCGAALAARRQR